jgi:hypothetical protein
MLQKDRDGRMQNVTKRQGWKDVTYNEQKGAQLQNKVKRYKNMQNNAAHVARTNRQLRGEAKHSNFAPKRSRKTSNAASHRAA